MVPFKISECDAKKKKLKKNILHKVTTENSGEVKLQMKFLVNHDFILLKCSESHPVSLTFDSDGGLDLELHFLMDLFHPFDFGQRGRRCV